MNHFLVIDGRGFEVAVIVLCFEGILTVELRDDLNKLPCFFTLALGILPE